MSTYKLIAFDMDRTLLNSKKQISSATLAAIKKAHDAGKIIVLSTGRCLAELSSYTDQIPGLRYLVCASGSLVYDLEKEKVLFSDPLTQEQVRPILEIAALEKPMTHILSLRSIVDPDDVAHMEDFHMEIFRSFFDEVADKCPNLKEKYFANPFPINKLNLYHRDAASCARTEAHIRKAGIAVTMVYEQGTSIEISPKGVTKASGLAHLCDHLGLSIAQAIAVGDSENDVDVLKKAGFSIAMGNAKPDIKALADAVVADCDHDGCVEAIEKYLLAV